MAEIFPIPGIDFQLPGITLDMPVVTFDEYGIVVPDFDAYQLWLAESFREIYGRDIYIEEDSQDGQMINIMAYALYIAAQTSAQVYHSFNPSAANGIALSRLVKINGIRRLSSSYSTCDVTIVGVVGTFIRNGIIEDILGNKWLLPASVLIPNSGEIQVTATAQLAGAIRLQADELNKISTPTRGWQTVTNPSPSVPGEAVESDFDLRMRQTSSTALPSRTVNEGIFGGILAVPGVTKARHYENFESFWALPSDPDTPTAEGVGIPDHSICDVVLGGDAQAIADIIRLRKTPGTGVYGDVAIDTVDGVGVHAVMKFYRPIESALTVNLTLSITSKYDSDIGEQIKINLVDYVGALRIGDTIRVNRLFTPIEEADNKTYGPTYDVADISVVLGGVTYTNMQTVPCAFNELLELTADDVNITVQEVS